MTAAFEQLGEGRAHAQTKRELASAGARRRACPHVGKNGCFSARGSHDTGLRTRCTQTVKPGSSSRQSMRECVSRQLPASRAYHTHVSTGQKRKRPHYLEALWEQ